MKDRQAELLEALNLDRNGDWDGAHNIVQRIESNDSYLIHAYLHRKEGDISNARYWYGRAGSNEFRGSLNEEWQCLYDSIR